MGDRNFPARWVEQDPHEKAAQEKLRDERLRAQADMAYRLANLAMPADIRGRARAWGMESFCEVLWNNAFQAGYREAMRALEAEDDRADTHGEQATLNFNETEQDS